MKLFLYFFYHAAKLLVLVVERVYYAKRKIANGERADLKGPCILVSNHPGTLLDPLNAAVRMHRTVHFLANAGLFSTPFSNWFFTTFYCIKIERYADTGGKPLNNKKGFRLATEHLTKGGCLYMAPEGGSWPGRRLQKLKTGVARIALITEEANDFKLGLQILPIALNYSDPGRFRSHLLTVFCEPIKVADFREDWKKDPKRAVKKMMACLHERMAEQLVDTADEEEDALLLKLEEMLQDENNLGLLEQHVRSQRVLEHIQKWREKMPEKYAALKEKVRLYFDNIKNLQLSDRSVKSGTPPFTDLLLFILLFPFFLLGFLSHFIPVFLTGLANKKLNKEPVWAPTFKVLTGLVLYFIFILLQVKCIASLTGSTWIAVLYFLCLYPLGKLAEWYLERWNFFWESYRVKRFAKQDEKSWSELHKIRQAILDSINGT